MKGEQDAGEEIKGRKQGKRPSGKHKSHIWRDNMEKIYEGGNIAKEDKSKETLEPLKKRRAEEKR